MSSGLLVTLLSLLVSSTLPAPDAFHCFLLFANHYLERSGTTVLRNVSSTTTCLEHCLNTGEKSKFDCRSVMWKKNTSDCILSRWSISQRPKRLKISQKMDVDLYENSCFNKESSSTVYMTSEKTIARTTTLPNSKEETATEATTTTTLSTPFPKLEKENSTDFRRFRAHHSKSLSASPLPKDAFHRVDGESVLPPLARVKMLQPEKISRVSNDDGMVVLSSQLDDWIKQIPTKPIRKGRIIPHIHPTATEATVKETTIVETPHPAVFTTTTSPQWATTYSFVTPSRPSPCFGRVRGYYLPNFEEQTIRGATIRQCLLTCLNTSTFFCASVHYQERERICTLNGGNVKMNKAQIVERIGLDYFENKCHLGDRDDQLEVVATESASEVKTVPNCFEERRDLVLASLDAIVIRHLNSLGDCISACTMGPVACSGLNWIPSTNGCMLFHGNIDKTQLTEGTGSSFYLNKCSGKTRSTVTKSAKETNEDYYDHDS